MADFLTVHENTSSGPIYCFHLDIIKDYKESWTYSTLLSKLNEGSLFLKNLWLFHTAIQGSET